MNRRLFGTATALVAAAGLLIATASAGPSLGTSTARGEGALRVMSKQSIPFRTGAQARSLASDSVKPVRLDPVSRQALASARAKLDSQLDQRISTSSKLDERFPVVVTTAVDPDDLQVSLAGMEITHTYHKALYGFSALLTRAEILALQAMPEVESIGEDQVVQTSVDSASTWTGVTKGREDFGLTGDGDGFPYRYSTRDVVIAVIDTGIDPHHKDLKGKVIAFQDFIFGMTDAYDDNGHGTHTAGTAAGAGIVNPKMKGVAPGAALVGVKVLGPDGSGSFGSVIAGIEWVVDNKDLYNIRVLNMSLGSASPSDGTDALSLAVNGAVEAGIVAVVAAGNIGPENFTIGSPGAAEQALTVCAMRDPGEDGWSLAPFSSRGPTLDGRIKPDLCAPGVRISAPRANSADRYVTYSGTSMAAPFVAGVAALMVAANPYLTADEVKNLLISTAQDWGVPGKDVDFGHGRINPYRAIQRILGLPGVGPVNPNHAVGRGVVAEGDEVWYRVQVDDVRRPIAATLLVTDSIDEYYDLDLFLYDQEGNELASTMEISRQESIHFQPTKRGVYYLRVQSYEGSGPFTLDLSWR